MSLRAVLPLVALMALTATAVTATPLDAAASSPLLGQAMPATTDAACAAVPPCGYIQPLMLLTLADAPKCQPTFAGESDLAKCPKLPGVGESVTYEGSVRWYWKLSEDLTYPSDVANPIAITFSGTKSNVPWMSVKIEPSTYTIDQVALLDPNNMLVDNAATPALVWYWFERPVTITITRTGSPDPTIQDVDDTSSLVYIQERIESQGGIMQVFARAYSSASGTYFRESFAVKGFGFDATALPAEIDPSLAQSTKSSPGIAVVVLPVLALAALVMRRRAA